MQSCTIKSTQPPATSHLSLQLVSLLAGHMTQCVRQRGGRAEKNEIFREAHTDDSKMMEKKKKIRGGSPLEEGVKQ